MSPGVALARGARRASWLAHAAASGPASSARSFASVGDRDAPPLAYELIEPPEWVSPSEAASAPLALVLHGLMGSGRNWRTFTRALSRRVADEGVPWRFALVDNLWHGRTFSDAALREKRHPVGPFQSAKRPDAPCAVDLAADAVAAVAEHIRAHTTGINARAVPPGFPPAAAVIGHSLGGKIALRALAKQKKAAAKEKAYDEKARASTNDVDRLSSNERPPPPHALCWTLDTVPAGVASASDPHGVRRVLDAVASLPREFASRDALRLALASSNEKKASFPRDLVDWLGTNLAPVDARLGASSPLRWVFDIQGVAALYDAYEREDEEALAACVDPPPSHETRVVRAARSERWDDGVVRALESASAAPGARVRFHVLRDAGHWLHVDNPDGLRALIAPELVRLGKELREYGES